MLVADGADRSSVPTDPEGFSARRGQFDSDITAGRYPRARWGSAPGSLIAVACDGRGDDDAGLTLSELAQAMIDLGAEARSTSTAVARPRSSLGGSSHDRVRSTAWRSPAAGRLTAIAFDPAAKLIPRA